MNYRETTPPAALRPYVQCYWELEGDGRELHHTILPNGYFELFAVSEGGRLIAHFLSGLRTEPFEAEIPNSVTVSAIRFKLAASEYLLRRPLAPLLNATAPLPPDYLGMNGLAALPFEARAARLWQSLLPMLPPTQPDGGKPSLLQQAYAPQRSVKAIAESTGWEPRRINRYFRAHFGLSLKTFLNIIRLRSCFGALHEGERYPDAGYYDQSHFIREVKKYAGAAPKELTENRNDRFLQLSVNKRP